MQQNWSAAGFGDPTHFQKACDGSESVMQMIGIRLQGVSRNYVAQWLKTQAAEGAGPHRDSISVEVQSNEALPALKAMYRAAAPALF